MRETIGIDERALELGQAQGFSIGNAIESPRHNGRDGAAHPHAANDGHCDHASLDAGPIKAKSGG